jgi:hypothetical protein
VVLEGKHVKETHCAIIGKLDRYSAFGFGLLAGGSLSHSHSRTSSKIRDAECDGRGVSDRGF